MDDQELKVMYEAGPAAEMIGLPACTRTEFCHLPDDGHKACEVDEDKWNASSFDEPTPES